jgi:hypothetical protein
MRPRDRKELVLDHVFDHLWERIDQITYLWFHYRCWGREYWKDLRVVAQSLLRCQL